MAMLLVGLLADAAFAHNPWGTEAVYIYSFSYFLVAAVIISLIILVIVAVLQFSAGKGLSFIEAAALCCAAIGGGSVVLGIAAMMLFFLSQAFYLNYSMMYVLCAIVQAFGSVLGALALYFTAIQGRKLCFVEVAAILLAALGGFRLLAKVISMVISHPPENGSIQIALLIGCFIPGALAAGIAAIQGRRKTLGIAHDETTDAD